MSLLRKIKSTKNTMTFDTTVCIQMVKFIWHKIFMRLMVFIIFNYELVKGLNWAIKCGIFRVLSRITCKIRLL